MIWHFSHVGKIHFSPFATLIWHTTVDCRARQGWKHSSIPQRAFGTEISGQAGPRLSFLERLQAARPNRRRHWNQAMVLFLAGLIRYNFDAFVYSCPILSTVMLSPDVLHSDWCAPSLSFVCSPHLLFVTIAAASSVNKHYQHVLLERAMLHPTGTIKGRSRKCRHGKIDIFANLLLGEGAMLRKVPCGQYRTNSHELAFQGRSAKSDIPRLDSIVASLAHRVW